MSEKCVVTFRVMLDTDQTEKARDMAEIVEDGIRTATDLLGRRFVLDTELTDYSFHGGRSFLYRDVPTKGDA